MNTYEIFSAALLTVAFVCFVIDALKTKRARNSLKLPAWEASLNDFLLFLWAAFLALLIGQFIVLGLYDFIGDGDPDPVQRLLLGSWGTHLPLLLFVLLAAKLPGTLYPRPLSVRPLNLVQAFPISLFYCAGALFAVAIITALWVQLLELLAPSLDLNPQELVQAVLAANNPVVLANLFILGVVVAPIWEEIIFRGGIYRFLKGRMPPMAALLLTSALFALVHLNLSSFLPLLLLGMLLTRAYERTGQIRVPILLHALFNLNTFVVLVLFPK